MMPSATPPSAPRPPLGRGGDDGPDSGRIDAPGGAGTASGAGTGLLRVAVVTTEEAGPHSYAMVLAEQLHRAGHDTVALVRQAAPAEAPGARSVRVLALLTPGQPQRWVRVGQRLAECDLVAVVPGSRSHDASMRVLLAALRAASGPQGRARTVLVLPPGRPVGRAERRLALSVDTVAVHDAAQLDALSGAGVDVVALPPVPSRPAPVPDPHRVRLLVLRPATEAECRSLATALSRRADLQLTAVGHDGTDLEALRALGATILEPSSSLAPGPLAALLATHDALVLTSAASQADLDLASSHGLRPLDPAAPPAGVDRLVREVIQRRLARFDEPAPLPGDWAHYLAAFEVVATAHGCVVPEPTGSSVTRAAGTAASAVVGAALESRRHVRATAMGLLRARRARAAVSLSLADLADLPICDVLADPAQLGEVGRISRFLQLPRARNGPEAWAALGALAAVVRLVDPSGEVVVIDESGPRSVFSRWLRAIGHEPVRLDFTGLDPSVSAMDIDAGSLDVITRLHPRGCDAESLDRVLDQASWALRRGGVLVLTVPVGPASADGCLSPADLRAALARADSAGFVLVGDLDGALLTRMSQARDRARDPFAAYALARLAWRKR